MLAGRTFSTRRLSLLRHSSHIVSAAASTTNTTTTRDFASQSPSSLPPRARRNKSTTSTALSTTVNLGEMNVTRHNFKDVFGDLKKDIELPTCRFIAIDTEFTGLSPSEDQRERFIDTLEERYRKVKRAGESFLVTQFGLSTVHVDEKQQFQIKTWNFYVFPRPYGSSDERFLCQASSLQFLSEHGFDFNKFIGDGIPFINLANTEVLRQRLDKRIDNLAKANKNLSLDAVGQVFQAEVNEKLKDWIKEGNGRNGVPLTIPARNSYLKMIIHETVRAKASYLYSESSSDSVEVRVVSIKEREELLAARAQEMREELEDAIGFSRVIEVLSKCKKPIIGHNALLDFVYVFNQFCKPLPDTLGEFKTQLLELFPTVFDTKHATLRSPLGAKLPSTSLSALFEYMRDNVKPTPENLLSNDPQFEGYRAALQAESDSDAKMLCHEAGFDAFMTGVCFLGLLAHDKNGDLPDQSTIATSERLGERMKEMDAFKNKLNLMISDEAFLDLDLADQKIDRSRVFRVSTTDKKRRLQHVKLEDLFEQPNKISRVVREGDRDAFVFMTEAAQVKDEATTTELGVTITTFDEYHATPRKRWNKDQPAPVVAATAESATVTTASQTTVDATTTTASQTATTPSEEAPLWNRCTIS